MILQIITLTPSPQSFFNFLRKDRNDKERNMKLISVCLMVLVLVERPVYSEEIFINECPCDHGVNCNSNRDYVWTTFEYTTLDGNATQKVSVRLREGGTGCDFAHFYEKISISFANPDNIEGYDGELKGVAEKTGEVVTLDIDQKAVLSLHDYHLHRGLEQFTAESYCVRRKNATHSEINICCGAHQSCIRKCCPFGFSFTNDLDNPCVPSKEHFDGWNHFWGHMMNTNEKELTSSQNLKIHTGFPDCQLHPYNITATLSTALGAPRRPFRLLRDGTLKFLGRGSRSLLEWKTKIESVDYCVDSLSRPNDPPDLTCGEDEQDVLLLCIKEIEKRFTQDDWIFRIVYMAGFVIAIVALLATATVHFLLWEKQNIHAWTILCYVVTLTGFYICLLIIYVEETRKRLLLEHYKPYISPKLCFAIGVIAHFMGIFSFSWLSVINFDLWWTFRILKPMNQRGFDFKRLFCYAAFALAVPISVVSVAAVFQIKYEKRSEPCRKNVEDYKIYPMYGQDGCFLANSSQPYYFYLPVGVLLLANLIFYLCTSCQMLKIYNATRRISDRNSSKQKQSCELFLKLFLVMGITWISQLILSVVENDEPKQSLLSILYAIFDMVNMFQAIAIFIIFVCKRETLRALEQKYSYLRTCLHPFGGIYRTQRIISRSTDGSTKMSRTELTKHLSIESSSGSEHRRDSELHNFS